MRGEPELNFPLFEAAEQQLLSQDIDVISPHRLDLNSGYNPEDVSTLPSIPDCARRDIDAIFSVDAIVFLPGWEDSKGAKAEKALAEWLEKPCLAYPDLTPL